MNVFTFLFILFLGVAAIATPDSHHSCSTKFGSDFIKFPTTKTWTKTHTRTLIIGIEKKTDEFTFTKTHTATITKVDPLIVAQTADASGGSATATVINSLTTTARGTIKPNTKANKAMPCRPSAASSSTVNLSTTPTLTEFTIPTTIPSTSTITVTVTVTNCVKINSTIAMVGFNNPTSPGSTSREVEAVAHRREYSRYPPSKRNSSVEYRNEYPQSVDCVRTLVTTISKIVTTTIKAHPITKTVMTTKSIPDSTEKWLPSASGTITVSTSITITATKDHNATTTKTATPTLKSVTSVPFSLECGDSKLSTTLHNGDASVGPIGSEEGLNHVSDANNAYQCCVMCFNATKSACQAGMFKQNKCFHRYSNSTCNVSASNGQSGGVGGGVSGGVSGDSSGSTPGGNSRYRIRRALDSFIKDKARHYPINIYTRQAPGSSGDDTFPLDSSSTNSVTGGIWAKLSRSLENILGNGDKSTDDEVLRPVTSPTSTFATMESTSITTTTDAQATINDSTTSPIPDTYMATQPTTAVALITSTPTINHANSYNIASLSTSNDGEITTSTKTLAPSPYIIQHFSGPCN